jgi:hypothetical protein
MFYHFYVYLNPLDNVIVLIRRVAAGTPFILNEDEITIRDDIELGHKVAVRNIFPGEKIIKCGMPIGSATREIHFGEHVHLHNMKSDYFPA